MADEFLLVEITKYKQCNAQCMHSYTINIVISLYYYNNKAKFILHLYDPTNMYAVLLGTGYCLLDLYPRFSAVSTSC